MMLSTLKETKTFRLDSDYFSKQYILDELFVKENPKLFTNFSDLSLTVNASAFYPALESYYGKGTIPFIRVADVKSRIDYGECTRIPHMPNEFSTLKLCRKGDIVLTKGGRVGTAGLILEKSYVTRDLIFINSSRLSRPDYIALYLYLCSDFSYRLMIRSSSMTAQPHLTVTLIRNIPIFNFSNLPKNAICDLYEESENLMNKSIALYNSAQSLLLSALNYQPVEQTESHTQKNFSTSFAKTGRLDAEYYQPKYDYYAQLIQAYSSGWTRISDVFTLIKTKCTRDKQSYCYVEIGDIDVGSGSATPNEIDTYNLPDNAKIMTCLGDVLVSTVRPNRGAVAILEENDLLVSGAFTVLRQNGAYPKEVLQVLLRTPLYRDWLLQTNVGTSYPVIKDADILNLPIPMFADDINSSVIEKVQESFSLRRQSKQLLENAKHAVEMAIEQGEDKAIKWLQEQCNHR